MLLKPMLFLLLFGFDVPASSFSSIPMPMRGASSSIERARALVGNARATPMSSSILDAYTYWSLLARPIALLAGNSSSGTPRGYRPARVNMGSGSREGMRGATALAAPAGVFGIAPEWAAVGARSWLGAAAGTEALRPRYCAPKIAPCWRPAAGRLSSIEQRAARTTEAMESPCDRTHPGAPT